MDHIYIEPNKLIEEEILENDFTAEDPRNKSFGDVTLCFRPDNTFLVDSRTSEELFSFNCDEHQYDYNHILWSCRDTKINMLFNFIHLENFRINSQTPLLVLL